MVRNISKKPAAFGRLALISGIAAVAAVIGLGLTGCNTLQTIDVQPPTRTVYGQGQELNTAGMEVTANYKKNSEEVVRNNPSLQITGYDKNTPGEQTITVTMSAKSGLVTSTVSNTFTVTVIPVESISISQPPATTSFKQGDNANWNGLSVAVKFEQDAVPGEIIRPGNNALRVDGYDKDKAGAQTITVDYYGKRATFNASVIGLDNIAVTSPPRKVEYFTEEELDLAGLVVTGTWTDRSTARVDITIRNLSGYDINRGGRQNVTVTYSGKTATFSVNYTALDALSVNKQPRKLTYELGEPLDLAEIQVQGTVSGSTSTIIVDPSRLKISEYDPLRAGEQRVTVRIGGRSDTFRVTVTNPFEGTWNGQLKAGTQTVDGKSVDVMVPVTLTISGTSWSLQTRNSAGESVSLSGVLKPTSNTHATLECSDRRGTGGVTRNSPTVMKLINGLTTTNGVTLEKAR